MVHLLTFRSEYECFQIELSKNYGLTEWRGDIKNIMLKAGLQDQQITFLFVDTQVNSSTFSLPFTWYYKPIYVGISKYLFLYKPKVALYSSLPLV